MLVEIYADLVCAWAYIGKRRFEAALRSLPQRDGHEPVEVVWRPFLIDPMAPVPSQPLEEALRDPVVDSALQQCEPGVSPADKRARVADLAADEGLTPWQPAWRASTWRAHRLVQQAAALKGAEAQGQLVERLLRAHFIEGRDLNDASFLADLAARHDLPEDRMSPSGYLRGRPTTTQDPLERITRQELLHGKARGVRVSPTFVVEGRAISGAQSPEILVDLLSRGQEPGSSPSTLPPEVELFRLAESLMQLKDPLGALYLLEPLQGPLAGDPNLDRLTARAYYASAQLHRALNLLERLVERQPGDTEARELLGRTLRRLGRADDAAGHLRLAGAQAGQAS